MDRGFFLTLQAMRRQLAAMPCDHYQIRLIHGSTRKPFPGDRVWSAVQLTRGAMVAFLRLRNREGYDIFFHPFAGPRNAGYILVDLDRAADQIIETMRANGHEPCVVLRTSPGHLQAWIRVSLTPLDPAIAASVATHLATLYGADRASADWHHCGRLAGFTNQKPARRQPGGYAPWASLLFAQPRGNGGHRYHAVAMAVTSVDPGRPAAGATGRTAALVDGLRFAALLRHRRCRVRPRRRGRERREPHLEANILAAASTARSAASATAEVGCLGAEAVRPARILTRPPRRRATAAAGTAGHRERRVLPRRSRRLASNHGPSGVTALFSLFFVCVLSYRTPSREDAKTAVNANV